MNLGSSVGRGLARVLTAAVVLLTSITGVGVGAANAAPSAEGNSSAVAVVDAAGVQRTLRNPDVVSALGDADQAVFVDSSTMATYGCRSLCEGKNPQTFRVFYDDCIDCFYKCADDAITPKLSDGYVYTVSNPVGSVSLRYSPRCRTAWARTTGSDEAFKVVSRYAGGSVRKTIETNSPDVWTLMVDDAGYEAQACFWPNGPYTGWTCTRWY
ncbi:DUF2690 domain-containing protein [Micromonospora eburnea]|uniref:DUF2690 domain-containing protein n=1 Tax=Micromonospora eburnea TaxID=227316 RepID=A0A1C6VQR6_9ACTN|nr:DUF2690 domain-containing protein [Micromonospora eburnea]SCL68280.1 Protein of unknown function [Micromonospora eburnea]